ncbi:sigma-54-dependent Fis family transcriptional regulator [Pseudomonas sp. RIT-PI-S]|uniref:sigma-54-dependent Fis family transcriptional regulator n=1 Tax=Pseudomonas sp. RIT-PI-S TaxID=3035295 RepID=UPI0021DAE0E9|nr:sigma-54-dependent Fis family transcriptional regulator [Pseudomonas sp. RIT-PI-S]
MSASSNGIVHEQAIREAWARSTAAGLRPHVAADHGEPPVAQVEQWQLRRAEVLRITEAQLLPAYAQVLAPIQALLLLADEHGRLLRSWGTPRFGAAQARAFAPGADWSEARVGCNALGTALACGQAVDVEHDEHFLAANRFMSGSAAPVFDAERRLVGVLGVSSDSFLPPSHTLGTVKVMAQALENALLEERFGEGCHRLVFNTARNNLDSPWAGVLVFDAGGRVMAANRRADTLLGKDPRGLAIQALFRANLGELMARPAGQPFPLLAAGRSRLQCLLQPPKRLATPCPATSLVERASVPQQQQALLDKGLRLLERDIPLLISGETGAGKEVLVKALHAASSRAGEPLVAVNCAAIPMELVEAELFGYEKGAFTGASQKGNPGLIRKADKGVLFFDEIGDMPLATQARLLRVLQERCIQPLGSGDPVAVDVRVICATHRDLASAVAEGSFREDLYYRIAGCTLRLPPLRERSDRRELIQAIWEEHRQPEQQAGFSEAALQALMSHPWPGNLRQLSNVIQVALALADNARIELDHLPEELLTPLPTPMQPRVVEVPAQDINALLRATDGNISQVARRLGVSRNTVYKRLREMNAGAWPTAGI